MRMIERVRIGEHEVTRWRASDGALVETWDVAVTDDAVCAEARDAISRAEGAVHRLPLVAQLRVAMKIRDLIEDEIALTKSDESTSESRR